jgi:hypothetical protein
MFQLSTDSTIIRFYFRQLRISTGYVTNSEHQPVAVAKKAGP